MESFLSSNPESFLLDPALFSDYFSLTKKVIPVLKDEKTVCFFIKNSDFCSKNSDFCSKNDTIFVKKEIDFDLFNEKITLIKNYNSWNENKNFSSAPIRSIIDFILIEALLNKISDIHFNIYDENKFTVLFKKDTFLNFFCNLTKSQFESIILCFKVLSELDTSKKHLPQSSAFSKVFQGKIVDFRFSTHPTFLGERFVLRVLSKKNIFHFKDMNLSDQVLEHVQKIVDFPNGLALFTGPTNSGKTTLIHSIISEIAKKNLIVMTLEDPVEYRVPGIIQTNVSENGLSFFDGMKSILRQDPDVIFLGEIRDSDTAKIAIQAALTGHKVLATLHAYSVKGAVKRLLDMGISKVMLAECLIAILSQRLVRRSCVDSNSCGLNLLVDSLFFEKQFKDLIINDEIDSIQDNMRLNAELLVAQNIISQDELKRVLG